VFIPKARKKDHENESDIMRNKSQAVLISKVRSKNDNLKNIKIYFPNLPIIEIFEQMHPSIIKISMQNAFCEFGAIDRMKLHYSEIFIWVIFSQ
jgi:hypothetical protein